MDVRVHFNGAELTLFAKPPPCGCPNAADALQAGALLKTHRGKLGDKDCLSWS